MPELYDFDTVVSPFSPLPPAVMGSFGLHVGTSRGTSGEVTGATIDLVPNNIELCIDTEQLDRDACTNTSVAIPVYLPTQVDSIQIVAANINNDPALEQVIYLQLPGTVQFAGDELVFYISIAHLDPEGFDVGIANTQARDVGDLLGYMCSGTTEEVGRKCNLRLQTVDSYVANHLAFELRVQIFRDGEDLGNQEFSRYLQDRDISDWKEIVRREILGLYSQPNCLYDQWNASSQGRIRQEDSTSLGNCPGENNQ